MVTPSPIDCWLLLLPWWQAGVLQAHRSLQGGGSLPHCRLDISARSSREVRPAVGFATK